METTLRAFLTFFKETNPWSEDYPTLTAGDNDTSIPTASSSSPTFYNNNSNNMYKRVFHPNANETSSEVTLDCSSFSENDYDSDQEFDARVVLRYDKDEDAEEVMTLSPSPSVVGAAHESSSQHSFVSSMDDTPRPLPYNSAHQGWMTTTTYDDEADEVLLLQELADRASILLQRESCDDYKIKNYFQQFGGGCCPQFPSAVGESAPNNSCPATTTPTPSSPNLPVDSKCRSIMMHWSFRVAEFALLNYEGRQRAQLKARLLSRTFSYVDRISTKFEIANRDQYKLLTIVCLHLAAKVGGLLKSNAPLYECFERCEHTQDAVIKSASSKLSSTPSSSKVMDVTDNNSDDSIAVETHQTIVPTPMSQGSVTSSLPVRTERCSTEYIWLLSLHGLHSLSNDEFTFDEFKEMEHAILHYGLNWRLSSVVALDWVDIYLEVMELLPPPLLLQCNNNDVNRISSRTNYDMKNFLSFTRAECDEIRDATLRQLEHALRRTSCMTYVPSLLGLAAFLNVMKGYCCTDSSDCDLVLLSSIERAIDVSIDYDDLYDLQVKMMFEIDDE